MISKSEEVGFLLYVFMLFLFGIVQVYIFWNICMQVQMTILGVFLKSSAGSLQTAQDLVTLISKMCLWYISV